MAFLGQFATRASTFGTNNTTGNKQLQARSAYVARATAVNPQFGFANWCVLGQNSGAATFAEFVDPQNETLTAALEYPAGTFAQIKFGGSATGMLTGGTAALLLSDAVAITIPVGAVYWIRSFVQTTGNLVFEAGGANGPDNAPIADSSSALGEKLTVATSGSADNTMGGAYSNSLPGYRYGPVLHLAQITIPSVLLLGDSRCHGVNDATSGLGDIGNAARAIGQIFGYTRHAFGSYRSDQFIASHAGFGTLIPYFSHVICELGINDLYQSSVSATTLLTRLQTVWGYFPNAKVYQHTLEPISTSSDSWATLANQITHSTNVARVSINGTIRGKPSPLAGYIEIADTVESARDSGLWVVSGVANGFTSDGIHSLPAGYALNLEAQAALVIQPSISATAPRFANTFH